jgi:hypothetical protein
VRLTTNIIGGDPYDVHIGQQVRGARTAVVTTGGGTPSGVLLLQRHDA